MIILLGDFNDLKIDDICETCSLHQVVKVPTRKDATLDLILTNANNNLYTDPTTLPGIGKSDHFCVVYVPRNFVIHENTKKKKCLENLRIQQFGNLIPELPPLIGLCYFK